MTSTTARGRRLLVVSTGGAGPSDDDQTRRLVAADAQPDPLLAGDAFDATALSERDLAAVAGRRGRVLRRLPTPVGLAFEVWRRRRDVEVVVSWGERVAFPIAAVRMLSGRSSPHHVGILMWPFDTSNPSKLRRVVKAIMFRTLARRGIDRLVVPSPLQRRWASERWGLPDERLVDLQWPIDTRFWRPMPGAGDMICSVGREMRDYATLIEALAGLDVPCHIAAGTGALNDAFGTDDPRAGNVAGRSLPPGVTTGPKAPAELRELYARSRIVVVPVKRSESDNGVTSVLEAMAMGRPVITTDTAGRADILQDGVNCVLVPPGDPLALRAAIDDLWRDPEACARLGAEARRRVVERHGLQQWVTGLLAAADAAALSAR